MAAPAPPSSAFSIPTVGDATGSAGAVIRDAGCTRRVFLMNPHLSADEIEGMAYRIRVLTTNPSIGSVLIANSDDDDETGALPSSALDSENIFSHDNQKPEDHVHYVSGGYDALDLYKSKRFKDVAHMQRLLDALGDLALATRGNPKSTLIPVITLPHGLVHDGGYALCMGGYVLATPDTCFKVLNPSKGLSFDPIGLSFVLPRLGWEFRQLSAEYSGCGHILALAGIDADSSDMMQTGLATHFVKSSSIVSTLERSLGSLKPWEQQKIKPNPITFYGKEPVPDVNKEYRNVAVAHLIDAFCLYNVEGNDLLPSRASLYGSNDDPSLDFDDDTLYLDGGSDLVNYAATFDHIFKEESSVAGIIDRLHEIGERHSSDPEEREGIAVAKDLSERMRRQSPLALRVIYSLMEIGGKRGETLESCIEREKRAQLKMFQMEDFARWAYAETNSPNGKVFTNWTYTSALEVPKDQVDEIIGG